MLLCVSLSNIFLKKAETCRRFTILLHTFVSNCSKVDGINTVKFAPSFDAIQFEVLRTSLNK